MAGVATFHTCTLPTAAGTYPVTATDTTRSTISKATSTIAVNPAAASKLSFHTPPTRITAGTTITTLVVWVEDSYGNHVTTGTAVGRPGLDLGGHLRGLLGDSGGRGGHLPHMHPVDDGRHHPVTATDATHGGYADASATITVSPGVASKLSFHTPPTSITAGSTITTLVVWVEDSYGNHVTTGAALADRIGITGATCSVVAVTALAGVATFHTCTL